MGKHRRANGETSPQDITPATETLIDRFSGWVERHLYDENPLSPALAVSAMANAAFNGFPIPADIFRRIDYEFQWPKERGYPEDPKDRIGLWSNEDSIVLRRMFGYVNGRQVALPGPVRTRIGRVPLSFFEPRALRPVRQARVMKLEEMPLNLGYNRAPDAFNYCTTECEAEVFHQVEYTPPSHQSVLGIQPGLQADLVLNKYPYASFHFLLCPERKSGHPQFLHPEGDRGLLEVAWALVHDMGYGKSLRLGYNSNGAHASVNHLHFQCFYVTPSWSPPLDKLLSSNGGLHLEDKLLPGMMIHRAEEGIGPLLEFIKGMNHLALGEHKPVAYNFVLTPTHTLLFPRMHQASDPYASLLRESRWTSGFACLELDGEILCPHADVPLFSPGFEKSIHALYKSLEVPRPWLAEVGLAGVGGC